MDGEVKKLIREEISEREVMEGERGRKERRRVEVMVGYGGERMEGRRGGG